MKKNQNFSEKKEMFQQKLTRKEYVNELKLIAVYSVSVSIYSIIKFFEINEPSENTYYIKALIFWGITTTLLICKFHIEGRIIEEQEIDETNLEYSFLKIYMAIPAAIGFAAMSKHPQYPQLDWFCLLILILTGLGCFIVFGIEWLYKRYKNK